MTIPSEEAKNARTILMKCCSLSFRVAQSLRSAPRSISSAVQNEPTAFLYSAHRSGYWIGNVVKRFIVGTRIGSAIV